MKISIFGLGYVGAVSAACLAAAGHDVLGVDCSAQKVALMNEGMSPVMEDGLEALIRQGVRSGRLRAMCDAEHAVHRSELSFICVGTPSQANGALDLSQIAAVTQGIGTALRTKNERHAIAVRSTVLPGTVRNVVLPLLESTSSKRLGQDFGLASHPEFLREGSAVADYSRPPKIVVGATDCETSRLIASLYGHLDAPLIQTSLEVSEMVKYADNLWHALKVTFANEVGAFCKGMNIDSHAVMDIFFRDGKLNLSRSYLAPGFAFGGSCLPKDVRALCAAAHHLDLDLPLLNAVLPSNARHIERGFELVQRQNNRRVTCLGLSFKPGTDDIRESPLLTLAVRLIREGYDVRIFDRHVRLQNLLGANRDALLAAIPHIASLLVGSLDEALAHGETIVLGTPDPAFSHVADRLSPHHRLVDLVRVANRGQLAERYDGIGW